MQRYGLTCCRRCTTPAGTDIRCSPETTACLVGYVEADDLAKAQEKMAATEVNGRWQESMSKFFAGLEGRRPDEGFLVLEEVFNLDDQLAQLEMKELHRP